MHGKSEAGGSDFSLLYLLQGLNRTRFRPIVVVPGRGPLTKDYERLCEKVIILPMCVVRSTGNAIELFRILSRLMPSALRLRKIIREEKIALVHTNSMVTLTGPLGAWLAGVPCVTHIREIVVSHPLIAARVLSFVCRLSDRIIAISNAVKSNLPEKWSTSDKVVIVYNGVDTKVFTPYENGESVRAEWEIPQSRPVVGIVGRIARAKGIHVFLKMIPEVLKAVPDAMFVVVGKAPSIREERYERALLELAQKLNLKGVLRFCGQRYDIPAVMAGIDVLVLASVNPEAMGRVLIEALACGKPVVATNHGGPTEIIEDGVTGFLIPPSNAKAMAYAIINLLKDSRLRQRMEKRGRELAIAEYSLEKCIQGVETIYESLLRIKTVSN